MVLDQYRILIPQIAGITRHKYLNKSRNKEIVDIYYTVNSTYSSVTKSTKRDRKTIGRMCEDDTRYMHPTTGYREIFPNEWEKQTGEKAPALEKDAGLFIGVKAICEKTGLKSVMEKSFGLARTEAILDYAMFSIKEESNATENLANAMEDEVLFNDSPLSDSYYSNLFERIMKRGDILTFRRGWAEKCREEGVEEVWLCIDGSNDDCASEGVEFAEHGHAKSRKNINIVSFSYAVTADGKPVTFEVYRGGLVDSRAMKSIIEFLSECDIRLRGVILDRGYCDSKAMQYLHDKKIPYIIMVKGAPAGYMDAFAEFGGQIKMNTAYWVENTQLFAAQKAARLYDTLGWEDQVTIFFDHENGEARVRALIQNINKELSRLNEALKNGRKASPKPSLSGIVKVDPGIKKATVDRRKFQEAIDEKGLYGLVSSEELSPEMLHMYYACRSESEIQYRITKTFLGYGVQRVQLTNGVRSKFCCAFISSILRQEIRSAAASLQLTCKQGIREIDLIDIRNINGTWIHDEAEVKREYSIISLLRGESADGKQYVQNTVEELNRRNKVKGYRHRKTGVKKSSAKADPSALPTTENTKRKPGPKPGFKRGKYNMDGTLRKSPGPKPGSKKGLFNKDGTQRKRPGPKVGSHHKD